ncbi:MAG: excinuclease ABC subunit UvrA [Flavobacteriia bacterium]|nr:excinuclease ABC subunit UvrA [Flavobacteriia bacterium]
MLDDEMIKVFGAREHNLKNVSIQIPRNQLVVFTGLSGSGKSSLAFDTIFAEGQRRYLDTFSSYARHFMGNIERPDVDKIDGLSPVIAIEQKTVARSPRSTVGTVTEVYDFIRLLFARVSTAYSHQTGEEMIKYNDSQIFSLIQNDFLNKKIAVLAPVVKARKGHYKELFEQFKKNGYTKTRVDGVLTEIERNQSLDRYKIHDIELVIDRFLVDTNSEKRLQDAIQIGMKWGNKSIMILDLEQNITRHFSRNLMCPSTGISYPEPEPNLFSFNSPYGCCEKCNGLGEISELDLNKIIPDSNISIRKGGLAPLGEYKKNWFFEKINHFLSQYKLSLNTPIKNIPEPALNVILYGNDGIEKKGNEKWLIFEGLISYITRHSEESSASIQRWAQGFLNKKKCPDCDGVRLRQQAYYFKIGDKNIADLVQMDIGELQKWFLTAFKLLSNKNQEIASDILKEINARLKFIVDVGLDYLTLNRSAKSLSGGEAQRIRLATQIGSELMNVLYILDEPSIGLHQRDNSKLITSLKKLRDAGNTVLVVEHDKEMMESADFIVDIGPKAGVHGGEITFSGTLKEMLKQNTLTARYLQNIIKIEVPKKRRKGNGNKIVLSEASGHNLKQVNAVFPLGTFICVTGVSGSGKSTLIHETLYPILNQHIYKSVKKPMPYKSIKGLEYVDKVIEIDQKPIGRTPRSNPATYTNVFNEIRALFCSLPEAQIRGYKAGRFSFNVVGGRCEECGGGGLKTIEMNFLPDVYVTCERCNGKRYNRETLEIRYKGKSINDVLEMTVEYALTFFDKIPKIKKTLETLMSVGLGYITLGQSSTTLSGGEAQRIKLSEELSKKSTGKTIYILDEPSTGLHFEDINQLLQVLNRIVDEGNTVIVIEHNLDIIKVADYIIDLGKEGGKNGGEILFMGTPEKMVKTCFETSHTAHYLKYELN